MSETTTGDPSLPPGLIAGADARLRCRWAGAEGAYAAYHDDEWGRPDGDPVALFEKLCLEGFQSGLSWITILRKREAFRAAFQGFSPERMAAMGEPDVERLVGDAGIVRHRGKIVSAINNARRFLALEETGEGFATLLWRHEPPAEERSVRVDLAYVAANPVTPASTRLSKALKSRGFSFVGPTTVYALMQAKGLVNDHLEGCACRAPCEAERTAFRRPG